MPLASTKPHKGQNRRTSSLPSTNTPASKPLLMRRPLAVPRVSVHTAMPTALFSATKPPKPAVAKSRPYASARFT